MNTTIQKNQISNYEDIQNAKKILSSNVNSSDYHGSNGNALKHRTDWSVKNYIVSFTDFSISQKISKKSRITKIRLYTEDGKYYIDIESKEKGKSKTPKTSNKHQVRNSGNNKKMVEDSNKDNQTKAKEPLQVNNTKSSLKGLSDSEIKKIVEDKNNKKEQLAFVEFLTYFLILRKEYQRLI